MPGPDRARARARRRNRLTQMDDGDYPNGRCAPARWCPTLGRTFGSSGSPLAAAAGKAVLGQGQKGRLPNKPRSRRPGRADRKSLRNTGDAQGAANPSAGRDVRTGSGGRDRPVRGRADTRAAGAAAAAARVLAREARLARRGRRSRSARTRRACPPGSRRARGARLRPPSQGEHGAGARPLDCRRRRRDRRQARRRRAVGNRPRQPSGTQLRREEEVHVEPVDRIPIRSRRRRSASTSTTTAPIGQVKYLELGQAGKLARGLRDRRRPASTKARGSSRPEIVHRGGKDIELRALAVTKKPASVGLGPINARPGTLADAARGIVFQDGWEGGLVETRRRVRPETQARRADRRSRHEPAGHPAAAARARATAADRPDRVPVRPAAST